MGDIQIPPGLQWVSYLAGGQWPQGSETGMFRMGEYYHDAADDLESLIPDLNKVRNETLSVLFGQTAQAADEQFSMLFDGEHAVGRLVDALSALGEGAENLAVEIEYSKLSILVGLALAAVEIAWCLAASTPTFGASTAAIPAIEKVTAASIRQVVTKAEGRVSQNLGQISTRTMVPRLVRETGQRVTTRPIGRAIAYEAVQEGLFQEPAIALTTELTAQGIQIHSGHRDKLDEERIGQSLKAAAFGGAAGGAFAVPVGRRLGPAQTRWGVAAKGATVMFSAGIVGNLAGTYAVGGQLDPWSMLGGAAFSSIGGLRGAGVTPAHNGSPATGASMPPFGNGPPPLGDLGPQSPTAGPGIVEQAIAGHDNDVGSSGAVPVGAGGGLSSTQHTNGTATQQFSGANVTPSAGLAPAGLADNSAASRAAPDAGDRGAPSAVGAAPVAAHSVGEVSAEQGPVADPVSVAVDAGDPVSAAPLVDPVIAASAVDPAPAAVAGAPALDAPVVPESGPGESGTVMAPVAPTPGPVGSKAPVTGPIPNAPVSIVTATPTGDKTPVSAHVSSPSSAAPSSSAVATPAARLAGTSAKPAGPAAVGDHDGETNSGTALGRLLDAAGRLVSSSLRPFVGGFGNSHRPLDGLTSEEDYKALAEQVLADHAARDWSVVSDEQLAQMLRGDQGNALVATVEVIRRQEGKTLRWTQVMATLAMRYAPVNMDAGEGKSLVFLAHAVWAAVRHGSVQVFTTRDTLANREFDRYVKVLGAYGFEIVRMNPDAPHPDPVGGTPTIYIGTQNDAGFGVLKDHAVPGRDAALDEIDEALVHANTNYILSEGAGKHASPEIAAEATQADGFLDQGLRTRTMTEQDFGREPGQIAGPAALTEAGRAKAEQILGRELTGSELKRLNMAATARWEYVEGDHYVVHDGKVFIIDQTTHKVMFDPETSTESRWNGGLAQAIEAKHGLVIRDDPGTSKSVTATKLFSSENYDSLTGASGTAVGVADRLEHGYGMKPVVKVPRFKESQLQTGDDRVAPDEAAKHQDIARDVAAMQKSGRPQLVISNRNTEVAKLSGLLTDLGVEHVAVDAKWFLEHGINAEADLQAIFDDAGQAGKVLVINRQGGRGVDIPVSDEVNADGGLHVVVTSRSAETRDIDVQAENRTARNGQNGSAQYYTSPEDALYQQLSHNSDVEVAVVRYTDAIAEHAVEPSDQRRVEVEAAADGLRALTPQLQEAASRKLRASTVITGKLPNAPPAFDRERTHEAPTAEKLHPPPNTPEKSAARSEDAPDGKPVAEGLAGSTWRVDLRDKGNRRRQNCAVRVVEECNEAYEGRDFRLPNEPTAAGVPGWELYQALNCRAMPVSTLQEVRDHLGGMSSGSRAVVMVFWSEDELAARRLSDDDIGELAGGHVFTMLRGDKPGEVQVKDPDRDLDERAVSHVWVGYLDDSGDSQQKWQGIPLKLAAYGNVAGLPGPGRGDDDQGEGQLAGSSWRVGEHQSNQQNPDLGETAPKASAAQRDPVADESTWERHEANMLSLGRFRDELQSRLGVGTGLSLEEELLLDRFNELHHVLRRTADRASQKGVGGPRLVEFDPLSFEGAVIVGADLDPRSAGDVVEPGRRVDSKVLWPFLGRALNRLESTLPPDPIASEALIVRFSYPRAEDAARAGDGILEGPFPNREYGEIKRLDLEDMRAAGLAPAEPGTTEFDSYIGNGEEKIKWAVLMDGRLMALPAQLGMDGRSTPQPDELDSLRWTLFGNSSPEIPTSHGTLTGDVPAEEDFVKAAGYAQIKKTDEGYQGIIIDNHSGHYHPSTVSLALYGLPKFAEFGIVFPQEGVKFLFGPVPSGWPQFEGDSADGDVDGLPGPELGLQQRPQPQAPNAHAQTRTTVPLSRPGWPAVRQDMEENSAPPRRHARGRPQLPQRGGPHPGHRDVTGTPTPPADEGREARLSPKDPSDTLDPKVVGRIRSSKGSAEHPRFFGADDPDAKAYGDILPGAKGLPGQGDGSFGEAGQPGFDGVTEAERTQLEAEIAAIRGEIASVRSSLSHDAQRSAEDEARLEALRARIEQVETDHEGMLTRFLGAKRGLGDSALEKMPSHIESGSRWLAARGVDVVSLKRGLVSLLMPGQDEVGVVDPDLRTFWEVIGQLTGVRGATVPEDPNWVEIDGLWQLEAALAAAPQGQPPILVDTAERIVRAIRNALAHDPTLPLHQISFGEFGSSSSKGTRTAARTWSLAYGDFALNVFAVDISVREVLQPQGFVDAHARDQASGRAEKGTGDAWTDVMLHEICGHGWQRASGNWDGSVAGVRRADPVTWAERRIDEHLDAAFDAVTAAGETPHDRVGWELQCSGYSRDPADTFRLNKCEAQAESAVYMLGNPDSDWRSPQYALYRALRGMPRLDSAGVERFRTAERLGVANPHLLDPGQLAAVLTRPAVTAITSAGRLGDTGAAAPIAAQLEDPVADQGLAEARVARVGEDKPRASSLMRGPLNLVNAAGRLVRSSFQSVLGGNKSRVENDCAYRLMTRLSEAYPGRKFSLSLAPGQTVAEGWDVFTELEAEVHETTLDGVKTRLSQKDMAPGSSAVVIVYWGDARSDYGAHAFHLELGEGENVYIDGQLVDEWPPYRRHSISKVLAAYLDHDGNSIGHLQDAVRQAVPTTAVAGLPGKRSGRSSRRGNALPGHPGDASRTSVDADRHGSRYVSGDAEESVAHGQADAPWWTRLHSDGELSSEYDEIDPAFLGELVDHPDSRRGQMLAGLLSRPYGPYRVEFRADAVPGSDSVRLEGVILNRNSRDIGSIEWNLRRDDDRNLVADLSYLEINAANKHLRRKGFSKAHLSDLESLFAYFGVDRIELNSDWEGSIVWARRGLTWNPDRLQESLVNIKRSAYQLRDHVNAEAQAVLDATVKTLEIGLPRRGEDGEVVVLPEPIDLLNLRADGHEDLGQKWLANTSLHLVKYLGGIPVAGRGALSRGDEAGARANCGYIAVETFAKWFPRQGFERALAKLTAAVSPMGLRSGAVFAGLRSRAQFATYADVENTLLDLGHGAAALLASRWAGSGKPGHLYLAKNVQGTIWLFDTRTKRFSLWPPHWGQAAVSRTVVGYFDRYGVAVQGISVDAPNQLGAADAIGLAAGHPDDGEGDWWGENDPVVAELLRRRGVRFTQELRHVPGDAKESVARAQANAPWWRRLGSEDRDRLIAAAPLDIVNAEGIPLKDRHRAYEAWRHQYMESVLPDLDPVPTALFNERDAALQQATEAADRAGVPMYVVAFDPVEDGGDGRIGVVFGDDPYEFDDPNELQQSQDWLVGACTTMTDSEQLTTRLRATLEHHQDRTLLAKGAEKRATVAWAVYDTRLEESPELARIAGASLYGAVSASNAGRDAWAADGSQFTNNKISGYGYGTAIVAAAVDHGQRIDAPPLSELTHGLHRLDYRDRDADLSFAHSLDVVLEIVGEAYSNGDPAAAEQVLRELGNDLSNRYGPFSVEFKVRVIAVTEIDELYPQFGTHALSEPLGFVLVLHGEIRSEGGRRAGEVVRLVYYSAQDEQIIVNNWLTDVAPWAQELAQQERFATTLNDPWVPWCRQGNVDRIEVRARNASSLAGHGYVWHPAKLGATVLNLLSGIDRLLEDDSSLGDADRAELQNLRGELLSDDNFPSFQKVATLGSAGALDLRAKLLADTDVYLMLQLGDAGPAQRAEEALRQRFPDVPPGALAADSVDKLVGSPDNVELSVEAARANAEWWPLLGKDYKSELQLIFPSEIGNAAGINAKDRHWANELLLRILMAELEALREKREALRENGESLDDFEQMRLEQLDAVEEMVVALRAASRLAEQSGLRMRLLAHPNPGSSGIRRVMVGFERYTKSTDDADGAAKQLSALDVVEPLSWHVDIDSTVGDVLFTGVHQAVDYLSENPDESATIAWMCWDAQADPESIGRLLQCDVAGFYAGRELLTDAVSSETHSRTMGHDLIVVYAEEAVRAVGHAWRDGLSNYVESVIGIEPPDDAWALFGIGPATGETVELHARRGDVDRQPSDTDGAPAQNDSDPDWARMENLANAALARRFPGKRPDIAVAVLLRPLGDVELAQRRARDNAIWWTTELTDDEKDALIMAYPEFIGNAEGIPAIDRDTANRRKIGVSFLLHPEQLRARNDANERLSPDEQFGLALYEAEERSRQLKTPLYLLGYEPATPDRHAHALVSFGNPDKLCQDAGVAKAVHDVDPDKSPKSPLEYWLAPGRTIPTFENFDSLTTAALKQVNSAPGDQPVAVIVSLNGAEHAETAGQILLSDIAGRNAGRSARASEDDRGPTTIVVSYGEGAKAVGHAWRNGLNYHVHSARLVNPPHASYALFGLEPLPDLPNDILGDGDRDPATYRSQDPKSRVIQPEFAPRRADIMAAAREADGAQRLEAALRQLRWDLSGVCGHEHSNVKLHFTSAEATESSLNLTGSFAVGQENGSITVRMTHQDELGWVVEQQFTFDSSPSEDLRRAAERALRTTMDGYYRLSDIDWVFGAADGSVPGGVHSDDVNCAVAVKSNLRRRFRSLEPDPDPLLLRREDDDGGYRPDRVFAELGAEVVFVTLADIEDTILGRLEDPDDHGLPDGSVVVLAVSWLDGAFGHVVTVVKEHGQLYLEFSDGSHEPFPPAWRHQVALAVAAYLGPDGQPITRGSDLSALDVFPNFKGGPRSEGLPRESSSGPSDAEGGQPGGRDVPTGDATAVVGPASLSPDVLSRTEETLGSHGATVYVDDNGQRWLVKAPTNDAEQFRVDLDAATARLQALASLTTPATYIMSVEGIRSSVQYMFPGASEAFPEMIVDASRLSAHELLTIQKHHVLDWLLSNHDAHTGQFLQLPSGEIVGIDKGQAFRFFGQDRLGWDYLPTPPIEGTPVYNTLFAGFAHGKPGELLDPAQGELADFIQRLQAIPDKSLRDMFRPYAEAAAAHGKLAIGTSDHFDLSFFAGAATAGSETFSTPPALPANDVDAFLDALVARKNNLAADMEAYYTSTASDRSGTTDAQPPTAQLDASTLASIAETALQAVKEGLWGKLATLPDKAELEYAAATLEAAKQEALAKGEDAAVAKYDAMSPIAFWASWTHVTAPTDTELNNKPIEIKPGTQYTPVRENPISEHHRLGPSVVPDPAAPVGTEQNPHYFDHRYATEWQSFGSSMTPQRRDAWDPIQLQAVIAYIVDNSPISTWLHEPDGAVPSIITAIDAAMSAHRPFEEHAVVTRGTTPLEFNDNSLNDENGGKVQFAPDATVEDLQALVGETYKTRGFSSTSLSTIPAKKSRIRVICKLKRGQPAIFLGGEPAGEYISLSPDEREVILPRDLTWRVLEVRKSTAGDDFRQIEIDVIVESVEDYGRAIPAHDATSGVTEPEKHDVALAIGSPPNGEVIGSTTGRTPADGGGAQPTENGSSSTGDASALDGPKALSTIAIKAGREYTPVRVNPVAEYDWLGQSVVSDIYAPVGSAANPHYFRMEDEVDWKVFGSLITPQDEGYWEREQLVGIEDYTDGDFESVNRWLRDGEGARPREIDVLDAAMSAHNPFEEHTVLTRAATVLEFNDNSLEIQFTPTATLEDLRVLVGATYTSRGFLSTSLSTVPAIPGRVRVIYKIRPGQRGIYVDGAPDGDALSSNPGELEVILPRDQTWRVLEVRSSSAGDVYAFPFQIDLIVELEEPGQSVPQLASATSEDALSDVDVPFQLGPCESGVGLIDGGRAIDPVSLTRCVTAVVEADSLPPDVLTATGEVRGMDGAAVYEDGKSQKCRVRRPENEAENFLVDLDVATAKLQALSGLKTPATFIMMVDGTRSSVQYMFAGPEHQPAFPGHELELGSLSAEELLTIQKHQILDWLMSRHDAHTGQFRRLPSGEIVAAGKGQAFEFVDQDRLDWYFLPTPLQGGAKHVYNTLWAEFAYGEPGELLDPSQGELAAFTQALQEIPDDHLRDIFRRYAEGAAEQGKLWVGGTLDLSSLGSVDVVTDLTGGSDHNLDPQTRAANEVEAFLEALVLRKNNLGNDMSALYWRAAEFRSKVLVARFGAPELEFAGQVAASAERLAESAGDIVLCRILNELTREQVWEHWLSKFDATPLSEPPTQDRLRLAIELLELVRLAAERTGSTAQYGKYVSMSPDGLWAELAALRNVEQPSLVMPGTQYTPLRVNPVADEYHRLGSSVVPDRGAPVGSPENPHYFRKQNLRDWKTFGSLMTPQGIARWDPRQYDVVQRHTFTGFGRANGWLRDRAGNEPPEIESLDAAFDAHPPFEQWVVLTRGTTALEFIENSLELTFPPTATVEDLRVLVGATYMSRAFLSMSLSTVPAVHGRVRVIYRMKPGQRGIYVGGAHRGDSLSRSPGEREVIGPRDQTFRVLEVRESILHSEDPKFEIDVVVEVVEQHA
ncbi:ADP-ribosyltransferase [Mycolicibacterium sp. XJ870]